VRCFLPHSQCDDGRAKQNVGVQVPLQMNDRQQSGSGFGTLDGRSVGEFGCCNSISRREIGSACSRQFLAQAREITLCGAGFHDDTHRSAQ